MPNIILVDDEIWALRDLENLLAPYPNYRILESFTNSKKALDAILSMHPDVVFTDLRMADLDGRDLINSIHEHSPQTAIVIISAYSDFSAAREALGRNVIDYLLKPLSATGMAELIDRLDAVLNRQQNHPLSPEEAFAAQLQTTAVYSGCCVLAFPDDVHPENELRQLYNLLSGTCSLCWSAEPASRERILLVSAPPTAIEGLLSSVPVTVGASRISGSFADFASMKQEAVISRICAFRYAVHQQVAAIEAYLALHFADDINLDNLAKHFFISKNYLCDIFRSITGATVMTFLMEIRLAMAAYDIRHTTRSIRSIAESVGYSDSAYFSRAFKKLFGMSPEAWRRDADN